MRRWRYATFLAVLVALLAASALWLASTGSDRAAVADTLEAPAMQSEGTAEFTIGDPALIRPPDDAYLRFADEDAAWRAVHAPPVTRRHFSSAAGGWRASPRQILRDSAFVLSSSGRIAEAIMLLERWVERNPRDAEQILELARLLNQVGRVEESLARYRQALALSRGSGR